MSEVSKSQGSSEKDSRELYSILADYNPDTGKTEVDLSQIEELISFGDMGIDPDIAQELGVICIKNVGNEEESISSINETSAHEEEYKEKIDTSKPAMYTLNIPVSHDTKTGNTIIDGKMLQRLFGVSEGSEFPDDVKKPEKLPKKRKSKIALSFRKLIRSQVESVGKNLHDDINNS